MNTAWHFLERYFPHSHRDTQGFWYRGDSVVLATDGNVLCPLRQYGFIAVDGPDSSSFLQGQTTCDWRQITAQQAGRGSYCNLKGRVLHSFLAGVLAPDQLLLRLRADTAASFCQGLAKYIVFSKAKMQHLEQHRLALGLSGPQAGERLKQQFGLAPQGYLAQHSNGEAVAIQMDEAGQRFECWLPTEQLAASWQALSIDFQVQDSLYWERLNILSGVGEICAATQDRFLPQMLNMQLTGAVNFKKGCYTGQEVIARMEYRGKLKKRMYRANSALSAPLPLPGTDIFSDDGPSSVGNIVNAAPNGEMLAILAVLNNDAAQGALHIGSTQGPVLCLQPLPYPVPESGD